MKKTLILFISLFTSIAFSQSKPYTSSEIYDDLLRLQNNATVMYLAAHPDDENTRVISWLSHEKHVDAVYLSLTRGDGGQNLIGTEKGELLGLLRTQELLEARKVDKGRQWFSRAVDFGYSKTTEDTYEHWDKEKVLGDVVWAIRVNQPEIIITRFDPNSNGKTHGHHTASAQLAVEAFDLAANPNAYPEQLKYVTPWQVKRLFFNTSWWFYGSEENFDKADKSDMVSIDVGTYFPHLGVSNNEISSMSRSKHACQGFGSALQRGTQTEWLQLLKGDMPKNNDIFDGIDIGWKDKNIQNQIDKTITEFDFRNPEKSLANLLKVYELAKSSADKKRIKEIEDLILKSQGIYAEWTTNEKFGTENQEIKTNLEIINRSVQPITFYFSETDSVSIAANDSYKNSIDFMTNEAANQSPYWLNKKIKNNFYQIDKMTHLGKAEVFEGIYKNIGFMLGNSWIQHDVPLQQKTVDPSIGELYEPFYVVPAFVVNFSQPHYLFKNEPKTIELEVTSFVPNTEATVLLTAQNGWEVSESQKFTAKNKGETQTFTFNVTPPNTFVPTELTAEVSYNNKSFTKSLTVVDYDHINRQIWLHDAQAKVQNLDIKIPNVKVGYIQGSGDEVPSALRSMGIEVDELDISQWNPKNLKNYDVILLGIRLFNTKEEMRFIKNDLWKFVENGGVVITQYNTSRRLDENAISPFKLQLGRDRISQELAELKILAPKHLVFNQPNTITTKDFDNWVQERGLYFGKEWDENLTPLLEGNDIGESPKQGMLLIGDYGKGKYVYTGLSFFRELPAGVPGAYRLMMNLLALGEK